MNRFKIKTNGGLSSKDKPKVYFTCHPNDFSDYFYQVCGDIFATHDVAIFYTEDMSELIEDENLITDLSCMNLVVVPVTFKLLTEANRAMGFDIPFAMEHKMRILPIIMEDGIDALYSQPNKFGKLQYLKRFGRDLTEIKYEDKLRKYLDSIILSSEQLERIRAEFDAYIFLSYRKQNRSLANKLMKLIHSNPNLQDIAIWYDEFLAPGEDFKENIDEALRKSKLFALLVTPDILEKPNFIMDYEYIQAKAVALPILPTEMVETDRESLEEAYENIPECIDPEEGLMLEEQILQNISTLSVEENNTPEHNYLIGLAYLEGIDVEVDRERGMSLITTAAEAEYPEAMIKLYNLSNEKGDYKTALKWMSALCVLYEKNLPKDHHDTLFSLNCLADTYSNLGDYVMETKTRKLLYERICKKFGKKHNFALLAFLELDIAKCKADIKVIPQPSLKSTFIISKIWYSKIEVDDEKRFDITKQFLMGHSFSVSFLKWLNKRSTKSFGIFHEVDICSNNAIASAYIAKGKFDKALKHHDLMYRLCSIRFGEEDPRTLDALLEVAKSYLRLSKYKSGLNSASEAFEQFLKKFGQNHPQTKYAEYILERIKYEIDASNEHIENLWTIAKWYICNFSSDHPRAKEIVEYYRYITIQNEGLVIKQGDLVYYKGDKKFVLVPETVRKIHTFAFKNLPKLEHVYIAEGVSSIQLYSFDDCQSLVRITIPKSVTNIVNPICDGCPIEFIDVDKDNPMYKSIEGNLYSKDGKNLVLYAIGKKHESFNIPKRVTYIGKKAFHGCKSLSSICIPSSVLSIGERAFWGCELLRDICIPSSVSSIGEGAFLFCKSLTSITVKEKNAYYRSIDGNLYSKDGATLIQYAIGKSAAIFKIPEGVSKIGKNAILGCHSLKSVIIPEGVTKIGGCAFQFCNLLTSITIPASVTEIGEAAFSFCMSLENITIPDSVTKIGDKAFECCGKLCIYGIRSSYAEAYALENGIKFECI